MRDSCSCVTAIVELHRSFVAWYRGDDGADLNLVESALADEFRLIPPDASMVERSAIIAAIRSKRSEFPNIRIEIRPVVCTRVRGLHLSTYEEWQSDDEDRPARVSTAVLSETDEGWRWHFVHETWLDPGTSAG